MPYIFLDFPELNYTRVSSDGSKKGIQFTQRIVLRTARRGSNNTREDTGRQDYLKISSNLHKMFNSSSVKQGLINLNIHKLKLDKISTDTLSIQEKQMYEGIYELSYMTGWLDVQS